jgi:hypothetical protein
MTLSIYQLKKLWTGANNVDKNRHCRFVRSFSYDQCLALTATHWLEPRLLLGGSPMEVLQSPFLKQSHWSSRSTVCFLLQGIAVHTPGVQPTLILELGIPVSAVLIHWWPWHDHWSPASAIGPASPSSIHSLQDQGGPNPSLPLYSFTHRLEPSLLLGGSPVEVLQSSFLTQSHWFIG